MPVMVSASLARLELQRRLQFNKWTPDLGITKDGKHLYSFRQDFPLMVFSYCFPYHYNNMPNYHDYLEVSYNCSGRGMYHVSNHEYLFAPGDVAIIASDEIHYLRASEKTNLDLISVFFLPEAVCPPAGDGSTYDLTRPFFDSSHHVLKAVEFDHLRLLRTMVEMYRLEKEKSKYYRLHQKHLLFDLLLQLLHHFDDCHLFAELPRNRIRQREADIHRLNPVFTYVEEHYRERIDLRQAARVANMSRNYFCRFFKRVTGTSFVDYLNKFRINRAKQLMLGGGLTTTQVAYQVGYNNLGYFYRSFKRYAHLCPREFVLEHGD